MTETLQAEQVERGAGEDPALRSPLLSGIRGVEVTTLVWLAIAVTLVAVGIWAFTDDQTRFIALVGSGFAEGAIVALAAVGFLLIWRATGIANFAQGDLITLGAYLAVWATQEQGWAAVPSYLFAIGAMFLVGMAIERVAYAPLRGRDIHVVVIATLGVAIVIRTIIALWQGTDPKFLNSPLLDSNFLFFDSGLLHIGDAVISAQRVLIIVVTLVVVIATTWLFSSTKFGRHVRALAADRETARLYGVPVNRLSMAAFGISAAMAGLAGVLIAPLGSFNITVGFQWMLLGFAAAVLGGFGSIGGVVVGGFMIGLTEQFLGGQVLPQIPGLEGISDFASTLPYVLMLIVIAVRPQGLFVTGGRRL